MNVFTTENQIYHIFSKFGPVERVQVIIDAKVSPFFSLKFSVSLWGVYQILSYVVVFSVFN